MHVYADNAATTAMSQVAIDAMLPYFNKVYGNPSSLHSIGQKAKEALEEARATVAACLGCEPREIYFTSGGSEADNQAIISAARFGARKNKKHIISTAFEHHAVLHTLDKLAKEGFEITYLDVKNGHNITAQQVKDAIREDTCLVAHGGVIACIMAHLFPEEGRNRYQWQPKNGGGWILEDSGYRVLE